jgi:predicted ATP-grasp superfamily ATP-dependent carboligase
MNVLVTNAQELQAYEIVCSLRADAKRIIITEGGDSVASSGFRGLAPYSRFVDASHVVPRFSDDWLAGRLQDTNTEAEEAYIRRVEEICAREQVDVIFPSLDPEVYVFAKNKERLRKKGILTVVPEPEILRVPMDKALTIRAALHVGFPCPATHFPADANDIEHIIRETRPPWIVKPRFTAHAAHIVHVATPEELRNAFARLNAFQRAPLVQQYIPGGIRRNYYVTVDRNGDIISLMTPQPARAFRVGPRVSIKTAVSASEGPFIPELRTLLRELRLWGGYTIQTQVDPADGIPKLMEINPRFGHHLWWRTRLGVNEPRICLQLAQGLTPTGNVTFPEGVVLLDPICDFFYFVGSFGILDRMIRSGSERAGDEVDVNPQGVGATLRAFRLDYLGGRRRVYCPEFQNLFIDPGPATRSFLHGLTERARNGVRRIRQRLQGSRAETPSTPQP